MNQTSVSTRGSNLSRYLDLFISISEDAKARTPMGHAALVSKTFTLHGTGPRAAAIPES